MIPFFTQAMLPQRQPWRPMGLLYGWLGACVVLLSAQSLEVAWLASAAGSGLCLSTAWAGWVWAGRPRFWRRGIFGGNRLLAMLHLAFAWLPVALLLTALNEAGVAVGSAWTHAMGLGFFSTMLVGFVTRVSMGHSGRALQADDIVWWLYLGLHVVAAMRVLAALGGVSSVAALHGLAVMWLVLIALWAARMLPVYWQPRADGQPG